MQEGERDRKREASIMENFLKNKDVWILGSVCLVATFLWRRWWKLFSLQKTGKTSSAADLQVKQQHEELAPLWILGIRHEFV